MTRRRAFAFPVWVAARPRRLAPLVLVVCLGLGAPAALVSQESGLSPLSPPRDAAYARALWFQRIQSEITYATGGPVSLEEGSLPDLPPPDRPNTELRGLEATSRLFLVVLTVVLAVLAWRRRDALRRLFARGGARAAPTAAASVPAITARFWR